MVTFIVLVLVLAAVGVAAVRFGADSRDGRDWQPYDIGSSRQPRW